MKNLVCKYCQDGFCVNDQCPMKADCCPVPNTPGVCKHEERVQSEPLSIKECMAAAFEDCCQEMRGSEIEDFFASLMRILDENGWTICTKRPHKTEDSETDIQLDITKSNDKWHPGYDVTIYDVANSNDWVFDHKTKDHDIHESIVYVTRDRLLTVSFDDNNEHGTIMLNKVNGASHGCCEIEVGQEVCLTDVERSNDVWKLKSMASSPFDTSCSYVSVDDRFLVEFGHQMGVGTVKAQYQPGMSVHVGRIGASPYWQCAGTSHDLAIYSTRDNSLFVAFSRDSDWGVIKKTLSDMLL